MRLYTVQHRPGSAAADTEFGPDVVLIKEGFCWPALFVPLLWLLYRLQFWGLFAYVLATIVLSAAVKVSGMDPMTGLALSLVLSVLVAAVANDWRRWRLGARGHELVTVVAAPNLAHAEEIFFRDVWQFDGAPAEPKKPYTPLPASGLTPFATPFDPV